FLDVRVAGGGDNVRARIQDIDEVEAVPLADFEVGEIVRRCNLHRARSLFGVGIFVGNDGDYAPDQRQLHFDRIAICIAGNEGRKSRVAWIDGNPRVAQHRLRPRGGDDDVIGAEAGTGLRQRILEVPQAALDLDHVDFEVGDGALELRIPV